MKSKPAIFLKPGKSETLLFDLWDVCFELRKTIEEVVFEQPERFVEII